jgi:hypothetical protein
MKSSDKENSPFQLLEPDDFSHENIKTRRTPRVIAEKVFRLEMAIKEQKIQQ